jgi:hypothetical protein
MPKSGEDLGVDIYELWLAGDRQLPRVADQFAEAGRLLGLTDSMDGSFWRPVEFAGGGYGPMHAGFANLRDAMTSVFRDSQANLELAAEALKLAASAYADTDSTAKEYFHVLLEDRGQGQF